MYILQRMETKERICRLCLKVNDTSTAIEGEVKDILNKFLPKVDLAVVREPAMCTNCAEMLTKCFNFKLTCRYVHDHILPNSNKENVKLDIRDIYLGEDENSIYISEDQVICGFCISPVKRCSAISFDDERRDIVLQTMIKKCLPELDLSIFKKPVVCTPCYRSLENCFHFVTNCLIVEGKIEKYCETLGMKSKSQIELGSLLQFTIRDTTSQVDNSVNIIKVENQLCEEREIDNGGDIFNGMFCDDSNNVKKKVEHKHFTDMNNLKFKNEQYIPRNLLAVKEESNNLVIKTEDTVCAENELRKNDFIAMEDKKFLFNEEIEIKTDETDLVRIENEGVLPQLPVITKKKSQL